MNNSGVNIENLALLEFQAGVSAVLRSWSALKTYVPVSLGWKFRTLLFCKKRLTHL
jgi:hypothetical protein